jgi:hypothetical protein
VLQLGDQESDPDQGLRGENVATLETTTKFCEDHGPLARGLCFHLELTPLGPRMVPNSRKVLSNSFPIMGGGGWLSPTLVDDVRTLHVTIHAFKPTCGPS